MIVLVRHGQTSANAAGLLLGRSDPALTDLGRRQARALGSAVAGASRLVTSPLARARQTAEALGLAAEVEVDDRWVEVDYGVFEGQPLGQVPAEVWQRWRADPTWQPPRGESLASVGRRVARACEDLAAAAAVSDVVVVSHVSPIKAAVAWALGVGDEVAWRMFLDVAAISRIGLGARGPTLRGYNDTNHLAGLADSHPSYP